MKTNTLRRQFISFLLIVICIVADVRSNPDYYFKQISLQEGLTQSTVRCILMDHKGFIWLGTKSGLNRYDRYELKTYWHEPGNPASLPNNLIHFIAEDSLYNVWIATETGMIKYNRDSDDFTRVLYNYLPLNPRSFFLEKDRILFGEKGAIYAFNYHNESFEKLILDSAEPLTQFFQHICSWNNKLVLGSRWNGIWIYNPENGKVERSDFCQEKPIISLFTDSKGQLWISPYGKGLLCYSTDGSLTESYNTSDSALSNDVILDIEERNNQLWIATDGGGINILDMGTKSFSLIEHIPGNIYSLPVNSIFSLYKSKENNMWAGSIRGGVFGIREVFIKTYKDVSMHNPYGLSEKTVLSLCEDSKGIMWIGTDGGGINRFDPGKSIFTHYPATYKDKVASIAEFNEEELFISLFSKGVFIFNKRTGETRPFIIINEKENDQICRSGITVNINRYAPDKIHFFADKIYAYDSKLKKFSLVEYAGKGNIPTSSLLKFYSDESLTYLFGQHHIFELNNTLNTIKAIYEIQDKSVFITTACRDDEGRFWIGTTKGLEYYHPHSNKPEVIDTKLFQEVSSLLFDNKGRIWVGAQGTLFAYLIAENKFVIFGESDGAYPNEFLTKPVLISQSGDIYMGGVTGLMHIDSDIELAATSQPEIILTDLILNGKSIAHEIETKNNSVSIPWDYTSLTLKHMVMEEDIFRKKIFRYTISGLTQHPIETYEHTLHLYSIPAGNYDVFVSCNTKDGDWSAPVKVLNLSVAPPWWHSNWFILLVIAIIASGITSISFMVIRRKENKLKWEMKEHEQKTYEEKVRFLINISHELRTPLTLIYAPLKRLLNSNIQDKDLRNQLAGIYKQAKQMKNIINMVLDVRKMEVGNDKINLQPHPLNEWIKHMAEDFKNEFEAKNINLKYELDKNIDCISFDDSKCEIILSNLLTNALKFSADHTEVVITTSIIGNNVRISVKDQGIGLVNTDTSKLFTRFYQGDHGVKGSGIGLSYAKTLIEIQGGRIGAESNGDKGSLFYYELPIANLSGEIYYEEKPYLNELVSEFNNHSSSSSKEYETLEYSLLIVEDETELCNFLKETFNDHFKKIYTAKDGEEALHIVKQMQPDIVISDIMMPRMDGFELCKQIKENIDISHIPVILLTARSDSESVSLGYKLGADAYIAKPFETEFLQTLIINQLRNREYMKLRYKNSTFLLTPEEMTFSNADEKFMLKLNKLIQDNLSDSDMDVKFITTEIGMSRASLYNKVKQLTDMGVNDYINKFRIEKAMQLLSQTDMAIMEVADVTGFSNQRYFSTVFKNATGSTPSKYKEKQKSTFLRDKNK